MDNIVSQWISTPAHHGHHNWHDDVRDHYYCAKFHYDPITGFCTTTPTCSRAYKVIRVDVFGSGNAVQPSLWADFYDQYVKWRRFAQTMCNRHRSPMKVIW